MQTCTPIGVFGRMARAAGFGRKRGLDGREFRRRLALRRQWLCPMAREKLRSRVRLHMIRCRRAINQPHSRKCERQCNHKDCNTHSRTRHTECHIDNKHRAPALNCRHPSHGMIYARVLRAPAPRLVIAQPPQGLAGAAPPPSLLVLLALGVLYALSSAMMLLEFVA